MKRTPLVRRSWLRSKAKRRTPEQVAESFAWYVAVGRKPVVASFIEHTWSRVERHHPVNRQVCRRYGVPEWDPRNGMLLTESRHRRHHSRHEPLTRAELPAEVWEFAAEYGLTGWLERHYSDGASAVAPKNGET